jgi:uronate dehydrogenase
MNETAKPILLTGASGALGRHLAASLAARGRQLRLTDIAPFPEPLAPGAEFTQADLSDGETLFGLAENCQAIVHFGAFSSNGSFEEVLGPNIHGVYHVYEAARRNRARVIFASSNHTIGFHERASLLDRDCAYRPDSFYGLSKMYGEVMARLYWDKHGVESVLLRIGSCRPQPINNRMLATWLSYADLTELVDKSLLAARVGYAIIWAVSRNALSRWHNDDRQLIGWQPQDSADRWTAELSGPEPGVAGRYCGGDYCAADYSRPEEPSR